VLVLQASGACYSWRLLPPRWLGGLWLRQSTKIMWCFGEGLWGGIVLSPWGLRRATLIERVIELPSLVGRFLQRPTCGLGEWCQLAVEPPTEQSTQRGLAWWQPSEPQDKNHYVILVFPFICISLYTSLYLHFMYCVCVLALVIS
jgi:hypothetical protein